MKKLIAFAVVFFVSSLLHAQQARQIISYQGMIQDANGAPVRDSIYPIAVSFWTDATGGTRLWRDVFPTTVTGGVFNIQLGSGTPLPSPKDMDRPLWISVSFNGNEDSPPRSPLSSVPMALNVPDSSITTAKLANGSVTWNKMGTEYIPYIRVNGAKVNTGQNSINFTGDDGLKVDYDSNSMSVIFHLDTGSVGNSSGNGQHVLNTGDPWLEGGNGEAIINPVLGSTNSSYGVQLVSGSTNRILLPAAGGITFNGFGAGLIQSNASGVLGLQVVPQWSSTLGAGVNSATDVASNVAGGAANVSDNIAAAIGGGYNNVAYGDDGVVAGGEANTVGDSAVDPNSFHSAIGGGGNNTVIGAGSVIPGGSSLKLGAFSFGFNGDADTGTLEVRGLPVPRVPVVTDLSPTGANLPKTAYFGNVNLMLGNVDGTPRALQFYAPNTSHTYSGAHYSSLQAGTQSGNLLYTLPLTAPDSIGRVLGVSSISGSNVGLTWLSTGSGSGGGLFWSLTGNANTVAGTNYIGTKDSQAFEIHVLDTAASTGGNKRVMRYTFGATSPNILGGSSANSIGTGLSGASILSGGAAPYGNSEHSNLSVIAGGDGNSIIDSSDYSGIVGGYGNSVSHRSNNSGIGFGAANLIDTNSDHSVIGGGLNNHILAPFCFIGGGGGTEDGGPSGITMSLPAMSAMRSSRSSRMSESGYDIYHYYSNIAGAPWATIGGGYGNYVADTAGSILGGSSNVNSSNFGSIGGGYSNTLDVSSENSTIGGGAYNYTWGPASVLGGGYSNTVSDTASALLGGSQNSVYSNYSVLVGGFNNSVSSSFAFLGGGYNNTVDNGGDTSVLVGGANNYIAGTYVFQGGGMNDTITSTLSVIVGGCFNKVLATKWGTIGGGCTNIITDTLAFIGGGAHNTDSAFAGAIAGGSGNTIAVTGRYSSIAGGNTNYLAALSAGFTISFEGGILFENFPTPGFSAIGGGGLNQVKGSRAFVGGGQQNTVDSIGTGSVITGGFENGVHSAVGTIVGGYLDSVFGAGAFIGGGYKNRASGETSVIPGGDHLIAQSYAQFVTGYYNAAQGTSSSGSINGNDFLAIFGNGTVSAPSDAFEISNNGHSIVHDVNGNTHVASGRTPIVGATYKDNTIIAWGDIPSGGGVNADLGVVDAKESTSQPGTYFIKLVAQDSKGNSVNFTNVTITATLRDNDTTGTTGQKADTSLLVLKPGASLDAPVCGKIVVSQMGLFLPPNQNVFVVHTYNSSCSLEPEPFFFKVCVRP